MTVAREISEDGVGKRAAKTVVSSPVRLNFVDGLPTRGNADTVSLGSVLGDVMIKECWLFNYLIDVDFVMYGSQG